jgi:hypothetical protein
MLEAAVFKLSVLVVTTSVAMMNAFPTVAEPSLRPGEMAIVTASGCTFITSMRPMKGVSLEKHKQFLAGDYETVRKCPHGELLHGPEYRVKRMFGNVDVSSEPSWFHQGRVFGYSEPEKYVPRVSILWENVSAHYTVDVDTAEAFAEQVRRNSVSAGFDGVRLDVTPLDLLAPRDDRRYELILDKNGVVQRIACPPPKTAIACFPQWQQLAGPIVEKAKAHIAQNRSKVEALKAALARKR